MRIIFLVSCFLLAITDASAYSLPITERYRAEYEYYRDLRYASLSSKYSKVWLLSYPRSGNTWIRYSIELLTHRPTFDAGRIGLPTLFPLSLLLDNELDDLKEAVFKAHLLKEMNLDSAFHEDDRLLVIVRNPKEVFLRQNYLPNEQDFIECHEPALSYYTPDSYFAILDLYDQWDPQKRMLVYYEDLLADPRHVLELILRFLDESTAELDLFFNNFDIHKKQSLNLYQHHGGTKSSSQDALYYSISASQETLEDFDALVQRLYPYLWQTYLKERYTTKK